MRKSGFPVLSCAAFLALAAGSTHATVLYWDDNGTGTPNSGNWDTTTKNWATSSTLTTSTIVWNTNDAAVFTAGATAAGTVTVTVTAASLPFAGIYDNGVGGTSCTLIVTNSASGSLKAIAGTDAVLISSGVSVTIYSPISGTGAVQQQGSGNLNLYGNNSYTGGTFTTGGQLIYYNQNNSFGTGTITISNSGGALVSGTTSALTITNNLTFATSNNSLNLAGGNPVGTAPGTTFTGKVTLPSSGSVILYTSSSATEVTELSGVVSGASALTIEDFGALLLGGHNTYSGATTVGGGGASGTPTLALATGGSIGNSATTVSNGCTFGSWTTSSTAVSNKLTFSTGSKALFNGSGSSVGKIAVSSTLALNSTAVTINVTGSALAAGTYPLLTCLSNVTGSAATTPTITGIALPSGYKAVVSTVDGVGGGVTLTVYAPPVVNCPSDINDTAALDSCGQTESFAGTVTNTPGSTITYNLGATNGPVITSPYTFPVGPSTVYVSAANPAGSGSCSFSVNINNSIPPVPGAFSMAPVENSPESVPAAKILSVCSNPRAGTLTISGVTSPTGAGATVAVAGGLLTYTPVPNYAGPDTIKYTVSDGCGAGSGTISVQVTPSNAGTTNVNYSVNGDKLNLMFYGVPGTSYHIQQSSPAPNGPWTTIGDAMTASSLGQISITLTNPPTPSFYRTTQP